MSGVLAHPSGGKQCDVRMMMDPSTTKETMVCSVAARASAWPSGGDWGVGSSVRAIVEMKIAPTPI